MLAESTKQPVEHTPEGEIDIDRLVHDLRGPLSVIVAFAETLEGAQRHERARYTERLVCNAHRALALLEEFSALHDLRSGTVELHRDITDLGKLCRGVSAVVAESARDGSEVRCLAPETPVSLMADRDLLGMGLRAVLRAVVRDLATGAALRVVVGSERGYAQVDVATSGGGVVGGAEPSQYDELEILQRVVSLHGGRVLFERPSTDLLFRLVIPLSR